MTITVFPVDAVAGAPSYTGQMTRQALSALVGAATSARPLGALSGVRVGTPANTVTATSTVWTCLPHSGVLDLEASAVTGAYLYAVGANVTGSVTAANATNPRVDIVYAQLSDPAAGDGTSTPSVVVTYLAGTAAPTPVPPATPVRSMVLAQINVPVSGGGSPTVTWVAPFSAASGGIVPCAGSAKYPASPYDGMPIYDTVLNASFVYNGAGWDPISAGFLYGETDGSLSYGLGAGVNTSTPCADAFKTVTFATQRRVRVYVKANFVSGGGVMTVNLHPAYAVGSSVPAAGSGSIVVIQNPAAHLYLAGAGAAGTLSGSYEHSVLLAAGTYTFFPLGFRVSGGANTAGDTISQGLVAVYDAGPV